MFQEALNFGRAKCICGIILHLGWFWFTVLLLKKKWTPKISKAPFCYQVLRWEYALRKALMYQKESVMVSHWFIWKVWCIRFVTLLKKTYLKHHLTTCLSLLFSCHKAVEKTRNWNCRGVCFTLIISVHEMLPVSNISLKVIFIYAFFSSLSCADCLLKELLHKETENSTNKTIDSALKMFFKVVMSSSYTWQRELGRHTRNTFIFVLTSSYFWSEYWHGLLIGCCLDFVSCCVAALQVTWICTCPLGGLCICWGFHSGKNSYVNKNTQWLTFFCWLFFFWFLLDK